jgi:hypothetical protein
MHEDELKRELQELATRLSRIEKRLGMADEPSPATPAALPIAPTAPATTRFAPSPPGQEVARPPFQDFNASKGTTLKGLQTGWQSQAARTEPPPVVTRPNQTPLPPQTVPTTAASASRGTTPANSTSLEVLIGGKWMAWVGALTVLLAVGFAIMVGVQRGWWGQLSPQFRCLAIAIFGALLLVGGEIALRRIGRAASVGLFSAGIGTLYMDAFATFRFFNLLSSHWAFVLMAAVAIVGFAITLRTRFLTIGILSIIGGYLTPILLRGQTGHDVELLSFLTMLFAISLGLSATLPRQFRALRYVAFCGQVMLGAMWIIGNAGSQWLLAIFFAGVWWAMTIAESTWAALRRQTPIGNVVMVLLATTAFVIGGCWVLRLGPSAPGFAAGSAGAILSSFVVANWLGIFTMMVAILSGVAAWHFGPEIREFRQPLRNAVDKLALALWAQMGALIAVAIGLQFRGMAQSIGWLAIGLAAIEIARRLPARAVTIFGLLVGGLGLFRVACVDWWMTPGMTATLWTIGPVEISKWSLLAIGTIIMLHVAAHRVWMPTEKARDFWAITLATIGTVGWLIVCSAQSTGLATTAGWLVGVATLLALTHLRNVGRGQGYVEIATFILLLSIARWLAIDALSTRLDDHWQAHAMLPLLNWQVAIAVAIITLAWWTQRILQSREDASKPGATAKGRAASIATVVQTLAFVLALVVLSFEVDRTIARTQPLSQWFAVWGPVQLRALLLTAMWAAGGLAMLRIGQLRRTNIMAAAGFLIFSGSAIVWLTFDSLISRVQDGLVAAPVIFNLQFVVGVMLAAFLALAVFWMKRDTTTDVLWRDKLSIAMRASLALIGAIGLLAGSLEIDRGLAHDPMLRHVGWSIYWGLYGVTLVMIGFMLRVPASRYAGLGLLAIVAFKVVLIDFAYLDDVPRVISTLVAGLLFIGTSMLYFKLAPRLQQRAP